MMKELCERFEFRQIHLDDGKRVAEIESICFPPNEACTLEIMEERVKKASDSFLVAIEKQTKQIAGFINGLATDEDSLRDEFFTNVGLHNPDGSYMMILGVDVLPEYRKQGLAKTMMAEFVRRESAKGRKRVVLTCLAPKVNMYQKMGFQDHGRSDSSWGGEEWHEMSCVIN
ncbi:MAG: N-acetyltransferase [Lachnospiraceae bacterium]|nr:N-acetyltransferase [Lachnospiraceae bacterium]